MILIRYLPQCFVNEDNNEPKSFELLMPSSFARTTRRSLACPTLLNSDCTEISRINGKR